jgi:hypothetical protein
MKLEEGFKLSDKGKLLPNKLDFAFSCTVILSGTSA